MLGVPEMIFSPSPERETTSTLKLYHTFLKILADYSLEESPFHSFHVMMN